MTSKLIAIVEHLLSNGVFVMTGKAQKTLIKSMSLSDDNKELTVEFQIEECSSGRNFIWHFNVESLLWELKDMEEGNK